MLKILGRIASTADVSSGFPQAFQMSQQKRHRCAHWP